MNHNQIILSCFSKVVMTKSNFSFYLGNFQFTWVKFSGASINDAMHTQIENFEWKA